MVHLSQSSSQTQKDSYINAFESFEKRLGAKDPSWLSKVRKNAIGRFAQLGFPTTRQENWRYTHVGPIAETSFDFGFDGQIPHVSLAEIQPFIFGQKNWQRLVFVNGFYASELSSISVSRNGLKLASLKSVLDSNSKPIEPYLARVASYEENPFTALNAAFLQDGAFIYLPDDTIFEEPIHLLFISVAGEGAFISQPRVVVVAGKNSKAALIESFVSLSGGTYFTNVVTEISLGEGASIEYHKIQRESERAFHIGTTQVRQDQDSKFSSFSIDLGGKLARNNLSVGLNAEGAACELNGLYLVSGEEHVDNTTLINHPKPQTRSRQLYKGLVSGKGRAVFFGKIFVHKNAQHTDASQTNKNLLLSETATVDTRPQLEILNDDVKCTHGAAVGQLDEEAIFYLKTRGIGEAEAQKLLSYGFAKEVIDCVKLEPIRTELDRLLLARLQDCSYFAWRDRMRKK